MQAFSACKREPYVILLAASVLPTVWWYFGRRATVIALETHPSVPYLDFYATLYEYVCAFVLFAAVPALVSWLVLKRRPRELGWCLGNAREGRRWVLIGIPVMLILAFLGARDPQMQAEYPLAKSVTGHWRLFILVELFYLLYYLGWEFFFRGFIQMGLERFYGVTASILIQTIPSVILHIGKPFSETAAALLAGIGFGIIAARTRSILYPMMLHAAIGIGTDIAVIWLAG